MRSDDKTKYSATTASRDSASRQQEEEGSFERNKITIEAGHVFVIKQGGTAEILRPCNKYLLQGRIFYLQQAARPAKKSRQDKQTRFVT